jgi:hypothetical protein
MKKPPVPLTLLILCALISRAQVAAGGENAGQYEDVQLQGVRVRLGKPIEVTAQIGWHMNGPDFDRWSFIHLTPMMAKFPGGELIVTYAMDPDTQQNPLFLSGFQISRDAGQHWGTRYGTIMQHIPMIFVPEERNALMAIPSELLGDQDGDHPSFRAPYLRFEEGGKRIVMEPDGVHVVDWPWPVEVHRNTQPSSNWHYAIQFTGDALRINGQLLATAYWTRKGEKVYTAGLLSSKDGGHTWRYYSTLATAADVLPQENWTEKGFEGPDETSMIQLANGDLMAVFRVGGRLEWKLRRSYSKDQGRTWSKPDVLPAYSVEPKLLRSANGVIVLATGRPRIGLWFSTDPMAKSWQHIDVVAHHNTYFTEPSYRISALDPEHPDNMWQTTSYTGLVELRNNQLLLVYDRDPERAPANPQDLSRVFVLPIEIQRQ